MRLCARSWTRPRSTGPCRSSVVCSPSTGGSSLTPRQAARRWPASSTTRSPSSAPTPSLLNCRPPNPPFHQPSRGGPPYGSEADVLGELHRFLFRLRVELGESRLKLPEEPPCRIAAAKLGKDPHPPPVELFGVRVDLDGLLQNSQGLVELALPGLELGKPGGGIEDLAAQGLADRFAPLAETPLEEV